MPFAMDWSPSGEPIAITSELGLLLLNPENISEASLSRIDNPLKDLAINPEGTRIATVEHGVNVFIWDASNGEILHTRGSFINGAHAVFYDRDGNLIIAQDAGPGDRVDLFGGGLGAISNATRHDPLDIHPSGNQAAVHVFGRLEIWAAGFDPLIKVETPFAADLQYSPDGTLLAAPHKDCVLRLWDPQSGEVIQSFTWCEDPEGAWGTLAFSRDGGLLAVADGQGTILVWDVAKDTTHQEIKLASGRILGLAFDPSGGKLASLHEEGLLQIWEIEG